MLFFARADYRYDIDFFTREEQEEERNQIIFERYCDLVNKISSVCKSYRHKNLHAMFRELGRLIDILRELICLDKTPSLQSDSGK